MEIFRQRKAFALRVTDVVFHAIFHRRARFCLFMLLQTEHNNRLCAISMR